MFDPFISMTGGKVGAKPGRMKGRHLLCMVCYWAWIAASILETGARGQWSSLVPRQEKCFRVGWWSDSKEQHCTWHTLQPMLKPEGFCPEYPGSCWYTGAWPWKGNRVLLPRACKPLRCHKDLGESPCHFQSPSHASLKPSPSPVQTHGSSPSRLQRHFLHPQNRSAPHCKRSYHLLGLLSDGNAAGVRDGVVLHSPAECVSKCVYKVVLMMDG